MAEVPPPADVEQFLAAASDFASYPGLQTDESVKEFLDRYPLPVLFSVLQNIGPGGHKFEDIIVPCLEKVFNTRYGVHLIFQYMPFVRAGLQADSQRVNCLACKAVCNLLEKSQGQDCEVAVQLIVEHDIYPLLVNCLLNHDELVATASLDAIKNLARSPMGTNVIFPSSNNVMNLKNIATHSSSVGRIRILSLVVKLFYLSSSVASAVYNSNLLSLFEEEISNTNDMLSTLNALELLYELAESPHSTEFLLKTTLLQLLASMISNSTVEPSLRIRAIQITGRLLSSSENHFAIQEASVRTSLLAIDERLELLRDKDTDECESALEALGEIGSTMHGAELLLSSSSPIARHVVFSAFSHQGRGKQLAALHGLASISGISRSEGHILLNSEAEDCFRQLIYEIAANSSKLTPSGLLVSILQQEPEIRLGAYRLIAALVARPWCLLEVCSKLDLINIVTDPEIETTKNGMEARYLCCTAISKSLSITNKANDPSLADIVEKLQEAVRRGPFLVGRKHGEAKPIVVTAERF